MLGLFDQVRFDFNLAKSEWLDITGDSSVLNITRCNPAIELAHHAREVAKYVAKFGDLSPADRWHMTQVLRGKRLYRPLGALRGFRPDESLIEDPLRGLPYWEIVYGWLGACYTVTSHVARQGDEAA